MRPVPYVLTTMVPEYNRSRLLVAAEQPFAVDGPTLRERLAAAAMISA